MFQLKMDELKIDKINTNNVMNSDHFNIKLIISLEWPSDPGSIEGGKKKPFKYVKEYHKDVNGKKTKTETNKEDDDVKSI